MRKKLILICLILVNSFNIFSTEVFKVSENSKKIFKKKSFYALSKYKYKNFGKNILVEENNGMTAQINKLKNNFYEECEKRLKILKKLKVLDFLNYFGFNDFTRNYDKNYIKMLLKEWKKNSFIYSCNDSKKKFKILYCEFIYFIFSKKDSCLKFNFFNSKTNKLFEKYFKKLNCDGDKYNLEQKEIEFIEDNYDEEAAKIEFFNIIKYLNDFSEIAFNFYSYSNLLDFFYDKKVEIELLFSLFEKVQNFYKLYSLQNYNASIYKKNLKKIDCAFKNILDCYFFDLRILLSNFIIDYRNYKISNNE